MKFREFRIPSAALGCRVRSCVSSAAACPGETNEGLARIIPEWMIVATTSLLVQVNGFPALAALAALAGIWFGRTGGGLNRAAATVEDSLERK